MNDLQYIGMVIFFADIVVLILVQVLMCYNTKPCSKILPIGDQNMLKIGRAPELYLNPFGAALFQWQKTIVWVGLFGWVIFMFGLL